MFVVGDRVTLKGDCESRSGITLFKGLVGTVHFIPDSEWGKEIIIKLDEGGSSLQRSLSRFFVVVSVDQIELVSKVKNFR